MYVLFQLAISIGPTGPGLHFVDVGQGSAMIAVDSQGEAMVFDSGPPGGAEALLRALDEHQIDTVALWIHTHFDADHVGGFARVVAGLDGRWPSTDDLVVERAWDRGSDSLPTTDAVALYWMLAGAIRVEPEPGHWSLGVDFELEIVDLSAPHVAGENDRGLAICLELDGLRVLVPGDLAAERVLEAAEACGPVDVLWASHHGSSDGWGPELVAVADPSIVVIGAGHANGYCHPSVTTLAASTDREVWLLDGAGLEPDAGCDSLAAEFGPDHHLVVGDLWIPTTGRPWLGMPGGGWSEG